MKGKQGIGKRVGGWSGLALAMIAVVGGCRESPATVSTFPTAGQVLRGGQPLHYASVVLHPAWEVAGEFTKPRGTTDADGRFQLTTFEGADGAPTGKYFVTVQQWVTPKPDEGPRNQLKPKYAAPQTSGIEVTITEGENVLPAISVD